MTNQLTPPPDHEVPAGIRHRQRDELVAIIDHESGAPRRRLGVPLLAAAAVLAVVAGLAFGVPALRGDSKADPAGTAPAATKIASGNKPAGQQIRPAKTRDLTAAEKAAFRNQCITFTDGYQDSFASFDVIQAFEYTNTARPGMAKSWLVTRKGMDYWICSRDGYGNIATTFVFGAITERYKDLPYLFAPVDERGSNAGMYIPSVARVTVQHDGEPAAEAVLKEGFWFAPMEDAKATKDSKGRPVWPDNHLIGVTPGWTIRGYDGEGKLVYNSATNGPDVRKCYSNPAATEVLVINSVKHPTPASCQKMFDWR
jgi:hypothetical protein